MLLSVDVGLHAHIQIDDSVGLQAQSDRSDLVDLGLITTCIQTQPTEERVTHAKSYDAFHRAGLTSDLTATPSLPAS